MTNHVVSLALGLVVALTLKMVTENQTNLVSHTTYVVCMNFIHKFTPSLLILLVYLSTPNDRFFKKLFMAILCALRVFTRNLSTGNR